MIKERPAPDVVEPIVHEETPPPVGPRARPWLWTIAVPIFIFLGFGALYLSTPTKWYTFDSVAYATRIRQYDSNPKATYLVHPHHLLFNSVGYASWKALGAVGVKVSSLEATQIMNSMIGALLLVIFYRLLMLRGFRWRGPPIRLERWPIVELAATVALGFTFGFWSISTDGRVNAPALLMLTVAAGYAWGAVDNLRRGQVAMCTVATVLAVGLHQSHGLIIAFCVACMLLAVAARKQRLISAASYLAGAGAGIAALYALFGFVVMGYGSIAEIRRWSLIYSEDGRWWKLDFWNNFLDLNTRAYTQSFVASPPLPNEKPLAPEVASLLDWMRDAVIPGLLGLIVVGLAYVVYRAWRSRSDPEWRRVLALAALAIPYTTFFTIWDPGYWVFWLPLTVATLALVACLAHSAPNWLRVPVAVSLLGWAAASAVVNGESSFLRRMVEANNPELVALKNLKAIAKPGDLLLTTGIGAGAKFEVYTPYFAEMNVSVAQMELKRSGGDFRRAMASIRGKIQSAMARGSKVFVAREFYADFQWDALGRRYQVPQGAQKLILAGYDRVEVPTGTKVRIFYLVRAPKSPPPPRFSLHLP